MFRIADPQVIVHVQEEALAFYTQIGRIAQFICNRASGDLRDGS